MTRRPAASAKGVPPVGEALRAIALNTFREAIRDRIFYLLLVFALLVVGTSRFLSLLTVGSEDKIIKDVGLSAISIFGVLTSVFVGVSLVFKEIERRTVYTLLANPVRRWQFVVGKYLGLVMVLAACVGSMTLALAAVVAVRGEPVLALLPAALLIFIELVLVTAFAILFSSFTSPILAALGTACAYVIGQLVWSFRMLQDRIVSELGRGACEVLYWTLPNLSLLNIKSEVVNGLDVPAARVVWGAVYGVSYAVVVLVVACAVFERRDFN